VHGRAGGGGEHIRRFIPAASTIPVIASGFRGRSRVNLVVRAVSCALSPNGFLKYPALIENSYRPCQVLRENNRFKVYSSMPQG